MRPPNQLSNTLLSYSHRDWDQAQHADPLCNATRRYIQLGRPNPPPRSLCDHLPSHTRPDIADITDLAAKGRLLEGDDDTILLVRKPITAASAPNGHNSHRSQPPFDDPVRIYVPLLARPWIMHACHAGASCHLGVTRTLKMLERFYWWVGMEVLHQMVGTTLPQMPGTKILPPNCSMAYPLHALAKQPWNIR